MKILINEIYVSIFIPRVRKVAVNLDTSRFLQKVFANKIKWVQACVDARGHRFQHLCSTFRTSPPVRHRVPSHFNYILL